MMVRLGFRQLALLLRAYTRKKEESVQVELVVVIWGVELVAPVVPVGVVAPVVPVGLVAPVVPVVLVVLAWEQ